MNLKLIKNTENINKEKITLFCLPFAGGGASAYNQWAKKMQGKVTVCPVQLPGNIGVDRTIFILEQLGFKWEKVGREEIIRAYHAIRESKKSGKKQY